MPITTPSAPTALTPTPLRMRVRDYIAEHIIDGTYPAGHRLPELEIARTLGTSQTPVREALRELAGMGFVDVIPNKGCRVRLLDLEDLRRAHPVRAALEEIAGFAAAPLLSGNTGELRAELERMRSAAEHHDLVGVCFHSTRFHRTIVEAAGNDALSRAWKAIGIEMLTLVGAAQHLDTLGATVEEHAPILSALETGNAAAAAALLRSHACNYTQNGPEGNAALCP